MTNSKLLGLIVVAFFIGISCGAFIYIAIKPTKSESDQLLINSTIREEACGRIIKEIASHKESPNTFKRGTLQNIVNESRETAKIRLPQFAIDQSFQYTDSKKSIFFDCKKLAQGWVNISSNFPEFYETEIREVGITLAKNNDSQLHADHNKYSTKKLALVIGNSNYLSKPLKNPINDAEDMAIFLKSTGFDVTEIKNADYKTLNRVIKSFEENLSTYEVGLIYYSGHGIEFNGRNYLIPIDAQLNNDQDIPRQGYDVSNILIKLSRLNKKTNIFILDACRNTPVFSQYRNVNDGLKELLAPRGTIIAYSAAPGQIAMDGNGRNSPYTSALLNLARKSDKKIEDILKEISKKVSDETGGRQVPWYNSSLTGDFYFKDK